nr:ERBB receptor feedback inhibitor 1-like [Nerophis lumbriciformis]
MRPECTWSMSTVGLTAQETYFPVEYPFLRGSYCHSMAGSKSTWSHSCDPENFYFTMKSAHTDHGSHAQHKSPPSLSYERHKHGSSTHKLPPKKSRPSLLPLSCSGEPSTPSPVDDDQVVPPFQRLSVDECGSPPQTPGRCAKPLPPIPLPGDLSSEQAMDNEVEFFPSTDESCRLVSDQCSKPSSFWMGLPSRRSFRDCGRINPGYYDGPLGPQNLRQTQPQQIPSHHPTQKDAQQHRRQDLPSGCQRQQDKALRKVRRSHSGPAGSLNKPSPQRFSCHNRITYNTDSSEVPPPIPPRSNKTTDLSHYHKDLRRWSAEVSYSDEDKPPKLPPRDPLGSPKTLPMYINGVMPTTQSFASDPNYVSRGLQRQNSEGSPCILPIVDKEGNKLSSTHYYLLWGLENPDSDWDFHTQQKAPVDLV